MEISSVKLENLYIKIENVFVLKLLPELQTRKFEVKISEMSLHERPQSIISPNC